MKIIFSGGGTLGSVTPLLAVAEEFPHDEKLWLGTRSGPERALVERAGIRFLPIPAGKLRRYFSLQTFLDPLRVVAGFVAALAEIRRFRPDVVVVAGGFVGVPVAWAARLGPAAVVALHLDVQMTLATRLTAPFARQVVRATEFGVPVRRAIEAARARRSSRSDPTPTILVLGGGTGARSLNDAIIAIAPELVARARIIHMTGGRTGKTFSHPRYHSIEFLHEKELAEAYASADIVVSRAGMGAIGDLSVVGIATILVPIPGTPQEANAEFVRRAGAAIVVRQNRVILNVVKDLIADPTKRSDLADRFRRLLPEGGREKLADIIRRYASSPMPHPQTHTPL